MKLKYNNTQMTNLEKATRHLPLVDERIIEKEFRFKKENQWRRAYGFVPNPKRIICMKCGSSTHDYGGFDKCNDYHCDGGTNRDIWKYDVSFVKDGNMWNARLPEFVNLQESDSGFGDTPLLAFQDLINIINAE